MKDDKGPSDSSVGEASTSEPSPFAPPVKPQKKDRSTAFSPTEDTFKDTANLVKEDSEA
jgi:low density lipoprotein-related protein 2